MPESNGRDRQRRSRAKKRAELEAAGQAPSRRRGAGSYVLVEAGTLCARCGEPIEDGQLIVGQIHAGCYGA